MKKKVLLVYPEIPTTYWSFKYALSFAGKKANIPPLGLMTVASMLPDEYEVKIIDMNISPLAQKDIEETDLVFISAMLVQKPSFAEVVSLCNACGKPVVAGGPYPISSYEKIKGVDHFVLGEAESTLPLFIRDLEAGCPQSVYRENGKPDITKTPLPRFDLIDIGAYNSMPLQFSRGCPFNCEFCDITEMFGRNPRTKLPEQFLNEMEEVYKTGFRDSLFVVDDNFVGNKKKVKALLRRIIEWQRDRGHPFMLYTEASINLAEDDELLDLMVQAGFEMVFVGIETPDAETLSIIHKTQNLRSNIFESVKKIQQKGIEVSSGFILGFDNDRDDIFDRQIEFIQKTAIPMAMVGMLTAVPNTQLFRRLKKEGRILDDTETNHTQDLRVNFVTRMKREELIEGFKRVISELYSPAQYFERCQRLLKRMPPGTKRSKPVSGTEIRAFLLSLPVQAFSSYGLHYLGFLIRTLRTNLGLFPAAVAMAIRGHHFFKITKEVLKADEFSTMLNSALQSFQAHVSEIVEIGKKQLAAEMEIHVLRHMKSLQKKYRRLSSGLQQYLKDTFTEFEINCEAMISQLRLSYV